MSTETFTWPTPVTDKTYRIVVDYMAERFPDMTVSIDDEGFITQSWPVDDEPLDPQ